MTNFRYHVFAVCWIEPYYVPFSDFFVLFSCLESAFSCSGVALSTIVPLEELLDSPCSIVFGSCLIMFGGWFGCTFMKVILLSGLMVWLYIYESDLVIWFDGLIVHLWKWSCYLVCGMACKSYLWGWKWRQDNLLLFCCILLLFLVRTL